jgi:hypothetical protein
VFDEPFFALLSNCFTQPSTQQISADRISSPGTSVKFKNRLMRWGHFRLLRAMDPGQALCFSLHFWHSSGSLLQGQPVNKDPGLGYTFILPIQKQKARCYYDQRASIG